MRRFTVVVERDPESGWLVGEVEELPGCFTEAPDMATLRTHLQDAIAGYLKVAEPEARCTAGAPPCAPTTTGIQ